MKRYSERDFQRYDIDSGVYRTIGGFSCTNCDKTDLKVIFYLKDKDLTDGELNLLWICESCLKKVLKGKMGKRQPFVFR